VTSLQEGNYLHIYNHANGKENLFREEKNFYFFLARYDKYISPIAATLAYCLMLNHYHFLIRIKETPQVDCDDGSHESWGPSHRFKNLFQSYTKAFNKKYGRMGSLFNQRFKRKIIASDDGIRAVMRYIHLNPVLHGFCRTPVNGYLAASMLIRPSGQIPRLKLMRGFLFSKTESNSSFAIVKCRHPMSSKTSDVCASPNARAL
jgi:hypothetical protein